MADCVRGFARGRVQGVGFRYFLRRCAQLHGVGGYANNLPDGRVEFLLQGDRAAIDKVVEQIYIGPRYAQVDEVQLEPAQARDSISGFETG